MELSIFRIKWADVPFGNGNVPVGEKGNRLKCEIKRGKSKWRAERGRLKRLRGRVPKHTPMGSAIFSPVVPEYGQLLDSLQSLRVIVL